MTLNQIQLSYMICGYNSALTRTHCKLGFNSLLFAIPVFPANLVLNLCAGYAQGHYASSPHNKIALDYVNLIVNICSVKSVKFYKTSSGKVPVQEFLDSLSSKHAQKVTWVLELIERLDQVPVQYFKKLKSTDDIWEVRARVGSNSFRLLGFIDTNDEFVILTNGFAKKSQKTPKKEIKLAEQRKADYLSRKGGKQ